MEEISEAANIVTECCKEDAKILFQPFCNGKAGELSMLIVTCEGEAASRQAFLLRFINNST